MAMTDRDTLLADLAYATDVAKRADGTPLLGGPIGLMWTVLTTAALLVHGSILHGLFDSSVAMTGLVWATHGLVGTALTVLIARRLDGEAGTRSLANRVAEAAWFWAGVMIAVYAVGTVAAFSLGRVDPVAFNAIIPAAFAVSAVANGILAKLTNYGYLKFAATTAALSTAVTLFLQQSSLLYFVAGLLLLMSGVIPSWIETRKARG